jgi:putative tryptophan/tyrosine transport system substrate-binding protein
MKRRQFIAGFGSAAGWAVVASGQPAERVRRVGVIIGTEENDPENKARLDSFRRQLKQLGWDEGRNVQIDIRFAAGDRDVMRKKAIELVATNPDVIIANGSGVVAALQQASRVIPIVFVEVVDPVGGGFVDSLARPGTNATGFTLIDFGAGGKWLELLKQIAPQIKRVAVLRDPGQFAGAGQLGAVQGAAALLRMEVIPLDVRDPAFIERSVASFAEGADGGLIALSSYAARINRKTIIALAARHRLPAVYPERMFVADGGLASYGPDTLDQWRQAAGYINRALRGEKASDLPVQQPAELRMVLNLKTAKALALNISPSVLARADEVIE